MKKLIGTVVVAMTLFVGSGIALPLLSQQNEGLAFAQENYEKSGGTWENNTCVKETTAVETKKDDIQKSTVTDNDIKLGYLSCGTFEFGCKMVNGLYWIVIIGGIINFTLRKVELHFMYPFLSCYTECHAEFIEA